MSEDAASTTLLLYCLLTETVPPSLLASKPRPRFPHIVEGVPPFEGGYLDAVRTMDPLTARNWMVAVLREHMCDLAVGTIDLLPKEGGVTIVISSGEDECMDLLVEAILDNPELAQYWVSSDRNGVHAFEIPM